MSKQLTTKPVQAGALTVHTKSNLMGVASELSNTDVAIPSLILMQANSGFVQESDDDSPIKAGDFLHSITKEVWGKKDKKPVELIFLYLFKTQIVSDVTGGGKTWLMTNQWSEEMELAEYEYQDGEKTIRQEKVFNYICFKSDEAREMVNPITGEVSATASPIVVKFKGGSLKNGKRLNQVFKDYASFGAPSWATSFYLSASFEENDKGKFWAFNFKTGSQSSPIQQIAAENLCRQFMESKSSIKVVDEETMPDIESEPRNVTPAPPQESKPRKNFAPQTSEEAGGIA